MTEALAGITATSGTPIPAVLTTLKPKSTSSTSTVAADAARNTRSPAITAPTRQPQGIPAGGQFALDTHTEPAVALIQTPSIEYKAPLSLEIDLTRSASGVLPK